MNRKYFDKISELMLFGIDFKEGDKLFIGLDFDCREAAKSLVAAAYARGAAFVDLRYADTFLHSEAIRAGSRGLDFPEYMKACNIEVTRAGWKSVSLFSEAEANVYEDLPTDVAADYFRAYGEIRNLRLKPMMNDEIPWTLTYLPSVDAAVRVFPGLLPEEAVEAYWGEIIRIMRLDLDDPVKFWKEKFDKDAERCSLMDQIGALSLHFEGPGTDFIVGLNPNASWSGGRTLAKTGELFAANIPTDEIFTSPDWRKAEGRVALTRPFVMHQNLGKVPINAWLEFHEGRVVDFGADEGRESLEALFARDERARYLGEVALVDPRSPFAEAGITFYNGLYDENAACHLALGKAYPSTLKKGGDYTDPELLELGMNTSAIHEDMMIGGRNVNVTAVLADGSKHPIISGGIIRI
ncbi:MAG: aminopeptidase [Spirochaetales bacterium]|nr:aminopeptidase [Spirochaetales bacterium]